MRTYVTHYFNFEYIGIYLLVSLIGLAVVIGIVLGVAKLKTRQRLQDDSLSHKAIHRINRHHQERKRSIIESFFEMVFASTSVLIFLSLYYVIDERIPGVSIYWQKYQDIILLLFLWNLLLR